MYGNDSTPDHIASLVSLFRDSEGEDGHPLPLRKGEIGLILSVKCIGPLVWDESRNEVFVVQQFPRAPILYSRVRQRVSKPGSAVGGILVVTPPLVEPQPGPGCGWGLETSAWRPGVDAAGGFNYATCPAVPMYDKVSNSIWHLGSGQARPLSTINSSSLQTTYYDRLWFTAVLRSPGAVFGANLGPMALAVLRCRGECTYVRLTEELVPGTIGVGRSGEVRHKGGPAMAWLASTGAHWKLCEHASTFMANFEHYSLVDVAKHLHAESYGPDADGSLWDKHDPSVEEANPWRVRDAPAITRELYLRSVVTIDGELFCRPHAAIAVHRWLLTVCKGFAWWDGLQFRVLFRFEVLRADREGAARYALEKGEIVFDGAGLCQPATVAHRSVLAMYPVSRECPNLSARDVNFPDLAESIDSVQASGDDYGTDVAAMFTPHPSVVAPRVGVVRES